MSMAAKRRGKRPNNKLTSPENGNERINSLTADEKEEIASLRSKIENIKNLEEKKKDLLREIEKLKKSK